VLSRIFGIFPGMNALSLWHGQGAFGSAEPQSIALRLRVGQRDSIVGRPCGPGYFWQAGGHGGGVPTGPTVAELRVALHIANRARKRRTKAKNVVFGSCAELIRGVTINDILGEDETVAKTAHQLVAAKVVASLVTCHLPPGA
jgi:hypothetical protein